MTKPSKLNKGDKVAIVSLSHGILGMPGYKHELDIAIKRLEEYGLVPVIMPHAMDDFDYLREHPELRASDLKQAFMDESIKGIICAIGGDDTIKTIPYLMEDQEFIEAVKNNPKIFTGFSDTTNNHLMLNKLGLSTFYGPCLLIDIAELDNEMLPYTKEYFDKFFTDEEGFGVQRVQRQETHGYEVLNGSGKVTGKLYGGCLDSFYDIFSSERYGNESEIISKYNILPTIDEWKEKILFLETSEEKMTPEQLEKALNIFKDLDTPVLYNVNFGHAVPRCIIPYDAEATIDFDNKKIMINSRIFENNTRNLN